MSTMSPQRVLHVVTKHSVSAKITATLALIAIYTLASQRAHYAPSSASDDDIRRGGGRVLAEVENEGALLQCSAVHDDEVADKCRHLKDKCQQVGLGAVKYAEMHFCRGWSTSASVAVLMCVVGALLEAVAVAAEDHFSVVVRESAEMLKLSPSVGGVTLLALGNGAPDLFASMAAMRSGNPRFGLSAILSGGAFVCSVVVGSVILSSAPFSVAPFPFLRDVFFYSLSVSALFYLYLTGPVFPWHAFSFLIFYALFVFTVFWTDQKPPPPPPALPQYASAPVARDKDGCCLCGFLSKVKKVWELPISLLFKLTIPSINSSDSNHLFTYANIALCPLFIFYTLNIPLQYQMVFLIPGASFPLWVVVLVLSSTIGLANFLLSDEPPSKDQKWVVAISFITSVCWISFLAGELMGCLAALGLVLRLPPAVLALTVLAWGNSIGDLVTDVAVAKGGQPTMAMAGCYAGPMFNMLVGLGFSLVICTVDSYPLGYNLHFHLSIVVAFGFLFISLFGSLLVVIWSGFQVPRFWGFCLMALYAIFVFVSLLIANVN